MSTESLQTYNKIEPSSYSIKDRIIQILALSVLLLWFAVYEIEIIDFNEYDDGSLIKAALFLALFFFIVSILQGIWTCYKIKSSYSYNNSKEMMNIVKWIIFGLFILMVLIPHMFFPEFDRLFDVYLIALTYAGKQLIGKISKNLE
jgi:magnesium-transporting ATPase (P-type)